MCTITNFLELIREARSQDKQLTLNLKKEDMVLKDFYSIYYKSLFLFPYSIT